MTTATSTQVTTKGRWTKAMAAVFAISLMVVGAPLLAAPASAAGTGQATTTTVLSDANPGQANVLIQAKVSGPVYTSFTLDCPDVVAVNERVTGQVVFTDGTTELGRAPVGSWDVGCTRGTDGFWKAQVFGYASITTTFPVNQLGTTRHITAAYQTADPNRYNDSTGAYDQRVAYTGQATTTTVQSNMNPGQASVGINATVSGPEYTSFTLDCPTGVANADRITGPVVFTDGTTELGRAPLGNWDLSCSRGTDGFWKVKQFATAFITTTFPPNQLGTTRHITASYQTADPNRYANSSGAYDQRVAYTGSTTTTTVRGGPNAGQANVRITATVTGPTDTSFTLDCPVGVPEANRITGQVVFTDGATELGHAAVSGWSLNCNRGTDGFWKVSQYGEAYITVTFPVSQLGTTHHITASYQTADVNRFASSSGAYDQRVEYLGHATTTTVSASKNPGQANVPVTARVFGPFDISLTLDCPPPVVAESARITGQVVFTDGSTELGRAPVGAWTLECIRGTRGFWETRVVGTATATVTFPANQAGTTRRVTATYQTADPNRYANSSGAYDQGVAFTGQNTTTKVSVSPSPSLAPVRVAAEISAPLRTEFTCPAPPVAADNRLAGQVVFTDGATELGRATVTNPRYRCTQVGVFLYQVETVADAAVTATFPTSQYGGTRSITATFVSADQNRFLNSSGTKSHNLLGSSLTLSSSVNPSIAGGSVTFTARSDECLNLYLLMPPQRGGGTLTLVDTTTGTTLGSVTVPQASCPQPTVTLTGSSATLRPGTHRIEARFTKTSGLSPSVVATLDQVVNGPDSTITTSGTIVRSTGGTVRGTAIDVGGPGVLGIVVYYKNVLTGAGGSMVATCPGCGTGGTNVTWSLSLANLPSGYYQFISQPVSVNGRIGFLSNAPTILVT